MFQYVYKSPGWDVHSEVKLREIDFPLFEEGCPDHFTIERTYEGPKETYKPSPLNTVDATYNGVAAGITGTAADDRLVFASDKEFLTGDPVLLTVSAGLASLTTATTYYLIRLDDATYQLATTRDNAIAGTAINITSDGTGTLTPAAAYLVRQSKQSDIDGGCVRYTRLFASIPAAWSDPTDTVFEFPGYTGNSYGTANTVNGLTVGSGTLLISVTSATTGISAGTTCMAVVKYTRGAIVYQQTIVGKASAVVANVSVTLPGALLGSAGAVSSVTGTIAAVATGRDTAENLFADCRTVHDYALSTVASLATDLPLIQKFAPTLAGQATLALTASTVPTASEYFTLISNGTEIVAECSRARYLGNIYVRKTRLVLPQ